MKKVTVDIDKLLRDGVITQDGYAKIAAQSQSRTATLGVQIFIGICIFGFAAAFVLLDPTFKVLPIVSALALIGGVLACQQKQYDVRIIAQTLALIGALGVSAWLLSLHYLWGSNSQAGAYAEVALLFLISGILCQNGVMVAFAVIALSPAMDVQTEYQHAMYAVGISNPLLTACVYGSLATLAYMFSTQLSRSYYRLAMVVSGTAFFMANMALWVGSLWGDAQITSEMFAVIWATTAIVTGVFGFVADKRAAVNIAGTFLAINAYTQYFERFQYQAGSLMMASFIGILIGILFWYYNAGYRPRLEVRST